jgi:hypothetical protein
MRMLMLLAAAAMEAADAQASPSATHQDRANRQDCLRRNPASLHRCVLQAAQRLQNERAQGEQPLKSEGMNGTSCPCAHGRMAGALALLLLAALTGWPWPAPTCMMALVVLH